MRDFTVFVLAHLVAAFTVPVSLGVEPAVCAVRESWAEDPGLLTFAYIEKPLDVGVPPR